MFRNIKEIRRIKTSALAAKREIDENGKSVLKMTVKDDDEFLSPYSGDGQSVISSEAADFIDNAAKPLDLNRKVHIIIRGATIDDEEKKVYRAAIKKYYGNQIFEADAKLKKNLVFSIVMALIGAAILSACVALHINEVGTVISELVDIVAWVFAWEAVDLFFLERPALRREQLKNCRLYEADITYEK